MEIYTHYLISSLGPTTATRLSRLLGGEISHNQITRFSSAPAKTSAELWRIAKPLVRRIERDDGVLVIDDSIEEKLHTDENKLSCRHWDNAKERNFKGINFLTARYVVEELSLPVGFDLVTKTKQFNDPKTGQQKHRSTISKNEQYRLLLHVAAHNQLRCLMMPGTRQPTI